MPTPPCPPHPNRVRHAGILPGTCPPPWLSQTAPPLLRESTDQVTSPTGPPAIAAVHPTRRHSPTTPRPSAGTAPHRGGHLAHGPMADHPHIAGIDLSGSRRSQHQKEPRTAELRRYRRQRHRPTERSPAHRGSPPIKSPPERDHPRQRGNSALCRAIRRPTRAAVRRGTRRCGTPS